MVCKRANKRKSRTAQGNRAWKHCAETLRIVVVVLKKKEPRLGSLGLSKTEKVGDGGTEGKLPDWHHSKQDQLFGWQKQKHFGTYARHDKYKEKYRNCLDDLVFEKLKLGHPIHSALSCGFSLPLQA